MPTSYADDFNRADAQPPGADYANMPSVNTIRARVVSNQLAADSGGSTSAEYLNPSGDSTFPVDVRVEIDVAALPTNLTERLEIFLRAVNPSNATTLGAYRLRFAKAASNYDFIVMSRNSGTGTLTTYQTVNNALTAGDKVAAQIVGAVPGGILKMELFTGGVWSTINSYTTTGGDADQFSAAGAVGLAINGAGWRLDNIAVSNLSASTILQPAFNPIPFMGGH